LRRINYAKEKFILDIVLEWIKEEQKRVCPSAVLGMDDGQSPKDI